MALFFEWMQRCAKKVVDNAGIVRDAMYYTFEAPLSGMSTNPARTFGSALHANYWHALWIYFIAPALGMLAAGQLFLLVRGGAPPYCAKLHHANRERCIFHHVQP